MSRSKRNFIITGLILIVAIAGGLWVMICGWPPIIIRDHQYRELIADFQRATLKDRDRPGGSNAGWQFQVELPESRTTVLVQAVAHMGVATVKYADEKDERPLYKYVDYSGPVEVRTHEKILYVHWAEILLRTDHYILAYDLDGRREIARRRIDPSDLMPPQ